MKLNESLKFLEDLKANNNREWFLANKSRYEAYKKSYHTLIAAILDEMKETDEKLQNLEVKNCTFRINRDIRFSKDKSPYKTHMGIWLSQNIFSKNAPGYYLHIEKDKSFVAGGVWCPEAEELKKIRHEIAFFYEDLEKIISTKEFAKTYQSLDREENMVLKTAPKGYEKDHPALHWLQLKSFTASKPFDNKQITSEDFVSFVAQKMKALKPLNDFLYRALETE